MKLIMYGTDICPDCLDALTRLAKANVELDYRRITESTLLLKEFLHYRDTLPLFDSVRERGSIGIPFFITEDGRCSLDTDEILP